MVNKNLDSNYNKFILDIGGYRNRHQQILEKIAKRVAKEVAESKRSQSLEQMNAYDRRIVHLCLKDHPEVSTFSDGEGSYRHIVITPKDNNESLSKGHAEIG
jgi:spoIIIJ-associated protein